MTKITTIHEGLKSIYAKNEFGEVPNYEIVARKEGEFTDHLLINGELFPIFYWRCEPQTASVANKAKREMGKCCSLKISGAISSDYGIDRFLYKELETAEWILDSEIKHLTAFVNGNTCNAILRMKNDKVAVLELGATLPVDAEGQTRHTAWGTKGMASTRIISQKVRGKSIYLFNDGPTPTTFNDEMTALYGLSPEDCTKTVTIASMLLNRCDYKAWKVKHDKLVSYVKAVYKSAKTGERVVIAEVE